MFGELSGFFLGITEAELFDGMGFNIWYFLSFILFALAFAIDGYNEAKAVSRESE